MHVYKVVDKVSRGHFTSARADAFGLSYAIGKWTLPKFGRILAFRTRAAAREFADNEKVFVAEAHVVTDQPKLANLIRNLEAFWTWKETEHQDEKATSPPGTVSCVALKLIREC